MRSHARTWFVTGTGLAWLSFALGACGGGQVAVKPTSLSSAPAPAPPASPPPEPKAAEPAAVVAFAEPTLLTDTQQKRDAAMAPKAAAFVDAFANVDPQLTKDHKKVLFRSNRDGVWQAYLGDVAKPAASATRLTNERDRVASARFTPDERSIVVTRDEGGDESYHVLRMAPDGSALVDRTPGDKLQRDPPVFPRLRPTDMVYSARDHASPGTFVFVQGVKEGEARKAYSDPLPGHVVDVSPDGSRALLVQMRASSDATLLRVDLETGRAARIFPQSEKKKVRIRDAKFSADGKRVYVASDDGGDASFVIRLEPGSGVVSGRYKEESPATASIAAIEVSPKDDRLAILVDEGSRTETRILDDALKPVATVKGPLGEVTPGSFSPDGKTFTVAIDTIDKPHDVFEADATTGVLKPLRTEPRAGIAAMPKVEVAQDRVAAFDGSSIPVNVVLPAGKRDKLGTLVVIHGGPASSAHVRFSPATLFFASQGYAVLEPNIRGSAGFGRAYELADDKEKRDGALKDLESVNKWAREQTWSDHDRVIAMGKGYGGYMTLLALGRQPSIWRAGIDLMGIADLRSFMRTTNGTLRSLLVDELGDPDKEAALLEQFSPIRDVDRIAAPLFVYQGANDVRVPRAEADAIVTALRSRKVPVEYMLAPDEGHSIERRETQVQLLVRAARFLEENVTKSAAPVNVALK